jgi:hypothetical protein
MAEIRIHIFRKFDIVDFVERHYMFDPETDDLIRGHQLVSGMRVLLESPDFRMDMRNVEMFDQGQMRTALVENRWCMVTELQFNKSDEKYEKLSFIAVYDDGTKFSRRWGLDRFWYVKLDSIPAE